MTGVFNRFPGLCAASSIASRNDIFSNGLSFHSSTPHSFPGFSVEGCLGQLIKAQEILEKNGVIEGTIHRYLIVAKK